MWIWIEQMPYVAAASDSGTFTEVNKNRFVTLSQWLLNLPYEMTTYIVIIYIVKAL